MVIRRKLAVGLSVAVLGLSAMACETGELEEGGGAPVGDPLAPTGPAPAEPAPPAP